MITFGKVFLTKLKLHVYASDLCSVLPLYNIRWKFFLLKKFPLLLLYQNKIVTSFIVSYIFVYNFLNQLKCMTRVQNRSEAKMLPPVGTAGSMRIRKLPIKKISYHTSAEKYILAVQNILQLHWPKGSKHVKLHILSLLINYWI